MIGSRAIKVTDRFKKTVAVMTTVAILLLTGTLSDGGFGGGRGRGGGQRPNQVQ